MKLPKVLILTTNYGNGHLQVAHSLERELETKGVQVLVRDLIYETSPLINEWTRKVYLKSYTKSGRQFYRLFYYSSKEISKRKNLKLLSYGFSKLKKIIEAEQPDLIINTFPYFAVPFHQNKTNSFIPTYNVVTDYCLHHLWVHPNIDKYYIATKHLKHELIKLGILNEKIVVTGIPIDQSFDKPLSIEELRQKYNHDPLKRNVLLVAGAYGVSKEVFQICELLKDDPLIELSIVCGKNEDLRLNLQMKYKHNHNVKIHGYVTYMAELLKLATCVITKPGGIILSEAMAMNTPIILPKATPGQEKENALFFKQQGAAIWNEKVDQLALETKQLVRNDEKLNEMRMKLAQLSAPHAAMNITRDILADYASRVINQHQTKA